MHEIIYDCEVFGHLATIPRKYHGAIRDAIVEQLRDEPQVRTRSRKPLDPPVRSGADWELRCGPANRFRVLYRVGVDGRVRILAIGVKEGDRLLVGGREFEL